VRADHPTQKPIVIFVGLVKASCPPGGIVLDPFMGSGTTAIAARQTGRHFTGLELNPAYCDIIRARLAAPEVPLAGKLSKKRKAAAKSAPLNEETA
jgi:site-specific DNA-methyltransferase (adenine-specific)